MRRLRAGVLALAILSLAACSASPGCDAVILPSSTPSAPADPSYADTYRQWSNGPNPTGDPGYWPIGVWLQNPDRELAGKTSAEAYSALSIDMDVMVNAWPGCGWCTSMEDELVSRPWRAGMWAGGLWRADGPPPFPGIERAKARPEVGERITMWGLDDEADMRRAPETNNPTVYPRNYRQLGDWVRAADPTRPVYSNFGKGMAVPGWVGYHAETPGGTGSYAGDMAEFCASSDIVSVDFYGWTDEWELPQFRGAWTYGRAIDSTKKNCGADKLVWGFVEGALGKPVITPDQIEAAAWNLVAHGANGLIWFAHQWPGGEVMYEDGLLRVPANAKRIGEVNAALKAIAPVLNAHSIAGQVKAESTGGVPVAVQHKRVSGVHYIVAAADGNASMPKGKATTVTFTLPVEAGVADVVGENRTIAFAGNRLTDSFGAYGHHVYRLAGS